MEPVFTGGGTGKKKKLRPSSLKDKGVHVIKIQGKEGMVSPGTPGLRRSLGGSLERKAFHLLGPRSCQGRDQLVCLSQQEIPRDGESDRLEIGDRSFLSVGRGHRVPRRLVKPYSAQVFLQGSFLHEFNI